MELAKVGTTKHLVGNIMDWNGRKLRAFAEQRRIIETEKVCPLRPSSRRLNCLVSCGTDRRKIKGG